MYFVSACLLGINCKYNGENNKSEKILNFLKDKKFVPICPEQLGGLSTPREPVEIIDKKVKDKFGNDFTYKFIKGAEETLKIITLYNNIEGIILKEGSPSCGVKKIADGTFSKNKISGSGLTARMLRKNGYNLISEFNFE
ncbi:MAG: DUF523 domain-containing protein [Bacillota bacterium]